MSVHEQSPDGTIEDEPRLQEAIEALAAGHDDLSSENNQQNEVIGEQDARIASLEAALEDALARVADLEGRTTSLGDERSQGGVIEAEDSAEQRSDTERDLARLSAITGRPSDDPELIKLHLRLKTEQFNGLAAAYESQSEGGRQVGFMQDMATAKRELEEAMYLYDPKFKEMESKRERLKMQLGATDSRDLEARRNITDEIRRLVDHGSEQGHQTPRRDRADSLTGRLNNISSSLDGSEILATYNLHQGEHPADTLSSRRRTDTVNWRGQPEYDENGVYIGSSPTRDGGWVLEPKPPQEYSVANEGETDPPGDGEDEPDGPEGGETDPPGDGEDEPDGPEGGETDPPGDEPEGPNERPPIGEGPEIVQSPTDSIMEVPPINPGDYPELYARRKNLVGGDVEALDRESERVRDEMAENVGARINNYRLENPGATLEQIRQFAMQCYVEAQNELQEDVIAAIDGQGYEDVNGEIKGRSRLRRFGAWMDRHGSKLKKGLLAAGAVGAVALTAGVAAGVIVPAFAIGAGTAIGAAKGAAVGLGMSRHGSKESVSRNIDVTSESYQELFAEMDPQSMRDYTKIADYLMLHYNASADKDHSLNVKKSGTAAAIGAVLGGLAGSISFNSLETSSSHTTTQVPNDPPDIPHHTIQPNELTGQVIDKTLGDMGIDASNFVNPDGSTNLQAIFDIVPKDQWISMQELANHTHSVAGADNLSNEGIRSIIETIVNNHDWGTHSVTQSQITQQLVNNLPFTIAGWVSGGALAAGASRAAADLTKSNSATRAPEVERFDEAEERESGNEPAPLRNGGRYSPPVPQRGEGGSDGGNASSPERRGERPETAEDWERTVNRSIASGDNGALRHVAELERRGYVERLPEDADSNGVQPVRLTDEGRRRLGLR